jgi:hypothetical protein
MENIQSARDALVSSLNMSDHTYDTSDVIKIITSIVVLAVSIIMVSILYIKYRKEKK